MNTRVLLMLDRETASRERRLVRRLRPLLAEEGVDLVPAVPDDAVLLFDDPAYETALPYRPRGLSFTRSVRVSDLVARLGPVLRGGQRLGAVHAFGRGCFRFAAELATRVQATLCLETQRPDDLRAARWVPSVLGDRCDWTMLVPGEPFVRAAVRDGLAPGAVRVVPWGVPAADTPPARPASDEDVSIVVSGLGDDPRAMHGAIEGIADAARSTERVLVLLDAHAARRARLWPTVRRLKLDSRLSLVPLMQGRRELVLHADLFVLPEAVGVHSTLPLDLAAHGACGVVARDPLVPWQSDPRFAVQLDQPKPHDWARTIEALINDPAARRDQGKSARDAARSSNRLTSHAAALLRVYDWASRRDAIRLPSETGEPSGSLR
ncbi:MAG: hypothetical protein AAF108_09155 [Planctomycetota bacterium]